MSDDLTKYLAEGDRSTSISPQRLEILGKEAANLLLDQRIPLSESILKLAASEGNVNSEQLKRICEFANTAVYLAQHDKNKTAGADSSYPQFELADPARIIQDLSMGTKPTQITATDINYSRQPEKAKIASAKLDQEFADLFGYSKEKIASETDFSSDTTVAELMSAKADLRDIRDNLNFATERTYNLLKQAEQDYYQLVRNHMLDEGSLTGVLAAARSTGVADETIAEIIHPIVEQLMTEKIASPNQLQAQVLELEKVAHRVINQEHELVTLFGAVASFQSELSKIAGDLEIVDEQFTKLDSFIKETYFVSR